MLSIKDNFLETLKKDGHPDRLVKQFEAGAFLPGDPIENYIRGEYHMGMEPIKDKWGTTLIWPEGYVAIMPHVTETDKVIPDITCWRDTCKVPDIIANCDTDALWEPFLERCAAVDRSEYMLMPFMHTGVFERLHFLMGFEDLFCNMYDEPEAMQDLCEAVGDYRLNVFKTLVKHVHPDLVLCHDDWGSKTNLFMQPDMWREFIKPQYVKGYGYLHDQGVVIMHHADSFLEPIVEDMVELHIDVWEGVLPENDIPKLQKQLDGRMTLMGGLDMAIIDQPDTTEEMIREEVRRALNAYVPGGHFIPCITYGGPGTFFPERYGIIDDEIDKYNQAHFA